MSNVVFRIISSSKSEQTIPVTQSYIISAEKGASYSLIDASTEQPIDGLVLKKQGDTLIIEVNGEVLAQIDEFYRPGQQATFNTGGISSSGDTLFISSTDSAADDSGVVWQASEISGLAAGDEVGVSTTGLVLGGLAVVGVSAALSSSKDGGSYGDAVVPDVTPPLVAPPVVADTTIVVFDLVGGTSSDHSGRMFDATVEYDIYIVVNSTTKELLTDANSNHGSWSDWGGANLLDGSDRIHLIGNGNPILTHSLSSVTGNSTSLQTRVMWYGSAGNGATMFAGGIFNRVANNTGTSLIIWTGTIATTAIPAIVADTANSMQGTIMTTQGLA